MLAVYEGQAAAQTISWAPRGEQRTTQAPRQAIRSTRDRNGPTSLFTLSKRGPVCRLAPRMCALLLKSILGLELFLELNISEHKEPSFLFCSHTISSDNNILMSCIILVHVRHLGLSFILSHCIKISQDTFCLFHADNIENLERVEVLTEANYAIVLQ